MPDKVIVLFYPLYDRVLRHPPIRVRNGGRAAVGDRAVADLFHCPTICFRPQGYCDNFMIYRLVEF